MARHVPAYDELQIRLAPGPEERYEVLAVAAGGATAYGTFALPFSPEALENFRYAVDPATARTVRGSRSPQRDRARQFGVALFDALMADDAVRTVYATSRQAAEHAGRGLRITLFLTRAPELAGVPWEFLYQRPDFLAQSVWTPIVRYMDLTEPPRPLHVDPPLRILGMISRPADTALAELDAAQERANLEGALAGLCTAGLVEIRWLEHATLRALQQEVAHGEDFHVFHYVGHGEYDERDGEGFLVLERPDGRAHHVSGDRLGTLIGDSRTLRLAVLNACEAAKSGPHDPLAGVAANLIEQGVPAVIGMQFAITDQAAVVFAEEFYATLADGYPVDAAVTEARRAMAANDEIEWGTPVLFMRVADGRLFDVAGRSPRNGETPNGHEPGTTTLAVAPAAAVAAPPAAPPPVAPPGEIALSRSGRRPRWVPLGVGAAVLALVALAVVVLSGGGSGSGYVTKRFSLRGRPSGVVADGGGGAFVTSESARRLYHLTARGKVTTIDTRGAPVGIEAGPDGQVFVAHPQQSSVARIAGGRPDPVAVPGHQPRLLAIGNAYLWTAAGGAAIPIKLRGWSPLPPVPVPGRPTGLAWAPFTVWLASTPAEGPGTLTKISTERRAVVGAPHPFPRIAGVATAGPRVWVTQTAASGGPGTVTEVDPATVKPIPGRRFTVGREPGAVASDGETLWVADENDGTVSVIDLASGKVHTVATGPTPVSIGLDGDAAWVADQGDATVTRITRTPD